MAWSGTPLFRTDSVTGRVWNRERRAAAPDELAGLGRGEIGGEVDVAKTECIAGAIVVRQVLNPVGRVWDVDNGRDRPGNDVPVNGADGVDRLDAENVRFLVILRDAEVRCFSGTAG
jgi:hypothetical protein